MSDETETGVSPSDSARARAVPDDINAIAARAAEEAAKLDAPEEAEEAAAEFVPEPDRLHTSQEVNLKKELFKMAKAQGLKPAQLNDQVGMRRSVYFGAIIREHFRARDIGYAEGMRDGLGARWPWQVWCIIGIALPFLTKFLVKLWIFGWLVYNSGG